MNEVVRNPEKIPIPGEIYVHCMGGQYRVEGFGQDATGYEEKSEVTQTILYTQLTAGKYPAGTAWSRSLEEFMHGTVEIDGEQVRIFTRSV